MDFELTEHQLKIKKEAHDFAQKVIAPRMLEYDETEEFPQDIINKMAKQTPFCGMRIPREYGGSREDHDLLSYVLVIEEISKVDSMLGDIVEEFGTLSSWPFVNLGTKEQKEKWLPPIARGESMGGTAQTEVRGGSDVRGLETWARLENHEWVIDGDKCFISLVMNPLTRFVIVLAKTGGPLPDGKFEYSSILVPLPNPGVTARRVRLMGYRAIDTAQFTLRNCRTPEENLIGERGRGLRQSFDLMLESRLVVAAEHLGAAQGCLDESVKRSRERVLFGQPIFNFQGISFKICDMQVNVEAARLLTYKAAWLVEQGKPAVKETALAKIFATEAGFQTAHMGLQIFGGHGYVRKTYMNKQFRDLRVGSIEEGTAEAMRIILSRDIAREVEGFGTTDDSSYPGGSIPAGLGYDLSFAHQI